MEEGRLVIRNSMVTRLLGCFTHLRKVVFCPVRKAVFHSVRTFWFFKEDLEIPFSRLSHMEYISGSSETGYSQSAEGFEARETTREFSLALVTRDNEMIEICTFAGGASGSRDAADREENDPDAIVERLNQILGIELKSGTVNRRQMFTRCPVCGRKVSRHARVCLYCKPR